MDRLPEPPRHVIRRQYIELRTRNGTSARGLGQRVEALALGPLRRVLERALHQMDPGAALTRVERLEIELGPISVEALETELPAALARALPSALAQCLPARTLRDADTKESATPPPMDASERAAALLRQLAREGHVPWWYDQERDPPAVSGAWSGASAGPLLARILAWLIETSPKLAAESLYALLPLPVARYRLAVALDGQLLVRAAALLSPATTILPLSAIEAAIMALPEGAVLSPPARATRARDLLLTALASRPIADTETLRKRIASALLQRFPAAYAEPIQAILLASWTEGLSAEAISAKIATALRPAVPVQTDSSKTTALAIALRDAAEAMPELSSLLNLLAEAAYALPEADAALAALRDMRATDAPLPDAGTLAALLTPFILARQPAAPLLEQLLVPLRSQLAKAGGITEEQISIDVQQGAPEQAALKLNSADFLPLRAQAAKVTQTPALRNRTGRWADEAITIEDAGLILLWPFLSGFFKTLELLTPKRAWRDTAAPHRAALLLDHVARGTLIAEEAHMPLIKLLVGLPIQAVLDPVAPLDAAERAACHSFLEAMLEHLAPLGRLTLEGLRGSWLLRPGLLERRDGLPLLRIERRGYDVLMDRLPWPRDWVRLPWMAEPLRVEW
ncbi:MAG: hypothetical protein INF81_06760 [Roseomonas sp.]|nr:hypothetical protein [Roseomonas sp.]